MRIGFALGGGGAKGYAHIGAIKVLHEAGIRPYCIAGTSIGALVGAVYAAGALSHLEREARDIAITDIPALLSPSWSLSGFFSGRSVFDILSEIIACERFDQLPMPFAAVSTDIFSGEIIVHTTGSIRDAVRASTAIPAVFTPTELDGRLLVDGGTVEPVPVAAARALGADFVIAIDLFGHPISPDARRGIQDDSGWPDPIRSALGYIRGVAGRLPWAGSSAESKPTKRSPNLLDIIEFTLALNQRMLTEYRLREHPPNYLLRPDVTMVDMLDFHRGALTIAQGESAARDALPLIESAIAAYRG